MAIGNWLRASELTPEWRFLPELIVTAMPWFVAGAAASCLIAALLTGDVRRTRRRDRARDALILGAALGLAAAFGADAQDALGDSVKEATTLSRAHLRRRRRRARRRRPAAWYWGTWCLKPAVRTSPRPSRRTAKALDKAMQAARALIRGDEAAKNWLYTPRNDLGGITPAGLSSIAARPGEADPGR